jgi:CRP/FNR family cyclic AMP-dependent transcriptional regulator
MARVFQFSEGDQIIKAGSIEKVMYIILDGEVRVQLFDGVEIIEVAQMKKGDFFGEISFFSDKPRSANVIAKTDGRCVAIDSLQQLNQFLMQNPKFSAKMVQILAERLSTTNELLIGKISDQRRVEVVEAKGVGWQGYGYGNESDK